MNEFAIPKFLHSVKGGDCLTTKYGNILLVDRVEIGQKSCKVYHYFDYSESDKRLYKNEFGHGFYGPECNEDFYRMSTEEERKFLFDLIAKEGYVWGGEYSGLIITEDEFNRRNGSFIPVGYTDAEELKTRNEILQAENKSYKEIFHYIATKTNINVHNLIGVLNGCLHWKVVGYVIVAKTQDANGDRNIFFEVEHENHTLTYHKAVWFQEEGYGLCQTRHSDDGSDGYLLFPTYEEFEYLCISFEE